MGSRIDPDELPGRILPVRGDGPQLPERSERWKHDYGASAWRKTGSEYPERCSRVMGYG